MTPGKRLIKAAKEAKTMVNGARTPASDKLFNTWEAYTSGDPAVREVEMDAAIRETVAENARLRAALSMVEPIQMENPVGRSIEEMKDAVRKTDLYMRGDTVLRWVSEADLCMHEMAVFRAKEALK